MALIPVLKRSFLLVNNLRSLASKLVPSLVKPLIIVLNSSADWEALPSCQVIISVKTFIAFLDYIEWKGINELLLQDIIKDLELDDEKILEFIEFVNKRESKKNIISKLFWKRKNSFLGFQDVNGNNEKIANAEIILDELFNWPMQTSNLDPAWNKNILFEKNSKWNLIITLIPWKSFSDKKQEIILTWEDIEVLKVVAYWLPIDNERKYVLE